MKKNLFGKLSLIAIVLFVGVSLAGCGSVSKITSSGTSVLQPDDAIKTLAVD